ncbi:MAG: radical SAM family heme chaperone HemW [Clostridia bacterium]|nr:radical SAM family heme chaperone HemW [Clostridia bacterium]
MKRCAVYVHIPFCAKKCAYCDFASFPGVSASGRDAYVRALIAEIEAFGAQERRRADSVFFGGGTPTLLSAGQLAEILSAIRRAFDVAADAEITVEANPGTVDAEKLRLLRSAGVNRLSFGAQSADDGLLRTLGRIHRWRDVEAAVRLARDVGFDDVSVDLMYALPGQALEQWRDTLRRAAALPISHISCYSLILEAGTPLFQAVTAGELALPDEDAALEMHRITLPELRAFGFERYEISNYAKAGHASRHNRVYWQRGDYAGFGCAAHSMVDGVRYSNPDSLEAYMAGERRLEPQALTARDALEETLMLTTRMAEGIDLAAFERAFGVPLAKRCPRTLAMLARNGAATLDGGRFRLTERGFEVHSYIVEELVNEWESGGE